MYSLLLSGLCDGKKKNLLGSAQQALVFAHRESCSEGAAAAMGSTQLPGEEEAGPANMVLPNKEAEIRCFILETSSPAQVCFLPSECFRGNL